MEHRLRAIASVSGEVSSFPSSPCEFRAEVVAVRTPTIRDVDAPPLPHSPVNCRRLRQPDVRSGSRKRKPPTACLATAHACAQLARSRRIASVSCSCAVTSAVDSSCSPSSRSSRRHRKSTYAPTCEHFRLLLLTYVNVRRGRVTCLVSASDPSCSECVAPAP